LRHLETVRRAFRPGEIRVLFVGESPPIKGVFFYRGDGKLVRFTMEGFGKAYKRSFRNYCDFLTFFRDIGCYLDDLSHRPINHLRDSKRREIRSRCVHSFARRLRELRPKAIICVMKGIAGEIEHALDRANLEHIPHYSLSFPGRRSRQYVNGLVKVLKKLQDEDIL